jgi:hypothetical protein
LEKEEERIRREEEKERIREEKEQRAKEAKEAKEQEQRAKSQAQKRLNTFFTAKTVPPASVHVERQEGYYWQQFLDAHIRPGVHVASLQREKRTAGVDRLLDGSLTDAPTGLQEFTKKRRMHDTLKHEDTVKVIKHHRDRRPTFMGTFSKQSRVIRPRCYLSKDISVIEYDFDSEEEWEDEGEGEQLMSEDEANSASESEDDEDGWIVPEGYLSEGEGVDEEEPAQPLSKEAPVKKKKMLVLQPIVRGFNMQPFLEEELLMYAVQPAQGYVFPVDVSQLKPLPPSNDPPKPPVALPDYSAEETDTLQRVIVGSTLAIPKLVDQLKQAYSSHVSLSRVRLPHYSKRLLEATLRKMATKTKTGWQLHASFTNPSAHINALRPNFS